MSVLVFDVDFEGAHRIEQDLVMFGTCHVVTCKSGMIHSGRCVGMGIAVGDLRLVACHFVIMGQDARFRMASAFMCSRRQR